MADPQNTRKLLAVERRAVISLSLIYAVRMLGLFIIFPVFSVVALEFQGASPMLVGLALGIYGLFQALLQIPFGMLSDRIGRKPVIFLGLALLLLGSVVAALADTMTGLIVGRALQGAGALSAALIALAADLTRDEQRTKVMAMLGGSIGFSFLLSLIIGPVLVERFSLSGLFWFSAFCTLIAMVIVWKVVPTPALIKRSGDTVAKLPTLMDLVRNTQLLRLDAGIFFLHLLVTALFVGVPVMLAEGGHAVGDHWQFYVPVLLLSLLIMIPAIMFAERRQRIREVLLLSIAGLGTAQLVLSLSGGSWIAVFFALFVFFGFFNTMEALLPSLITRTAPAGTRGSAMGVYSTCQFAGAFVGGTGGGWLLGQFGLQGLFTGLCVVCLIWFFLSVGQRPPVGISTHLHSLGSLSKDEIEQWTSSCLLVEGVQDAVVVPEEGLAYLKVDRRVFSAANLPPGPG